MTRLLVSLAEPERRWLERKARETGSSMAELIRRSIRQMKTAEEKSYEDLLKATSGMWRAGDGLRYQRKARKEWDERSS